jgi:hypothetical protein
VRSREASLRLPFDTRNASSLYLSVCSNLGACCGPCGTNKKGWIYIDGSQHFMALPLLLSLFRYIHSCATVLYHGSIRQAISISGALQGLGGLGRRLVATFSTFPGYLFAQLILENRDIFFMKKLKRGEGK